MKLPERLYYPLDKAAIKLNCDVSDIMHFAANGYVSLCFRCIIDSMAKTDTCFDMTLEVDEDALDVFVRDEVKSGKPEMEVQYGLSNSYFSLGGFFKLMIEDGRLNGYFFSLESYMGLIEIGQTTIYRKQGFFLNGDMVDIDWMFTPEDHNESPIGFFEDKMGYGKDVLPFVLDEFNKHLLISVIHEVGDYPSINIDDLVITQTELNRLINHGVKSNDAVEAPKTSALKGDIIRPLIQMLPGFNNVDIDSLPVSKIKDMIEASAAEKGIEFPEVYRSTWQKYLGRSRMIK